MIRKLARAALAVPFIVDGVDAATKPAGHVAQARQLLQSASRCPQIPQLSDTQLTAAVRAHGVATAVAGAGLALTRHPRTAAVALAALALPIAVVQVTAEPDPALSRKEKAAARKVQARRALTSVALLGGVIITALDTQGNPSLRWRAAKQLSDYRERLSSDQSSAPE